MNDVLGVPAAKPNGSRTQRAKRHLAEARRTAFNRLEDGRRQAKAAIETNSRQRARRYLDESFASEWPQRLKKWALGKLATVAAWKIERDTWRVALERQKLSFDEFTACLRQGGRLGRLARD